MSWEIDKQGPQALRIPTLQKELGNQIPLPLSLLQEDGGGSPEETGMRFSCSGPLKSDNRLAERAEFIHPTTREVAVFARAGAVLCMVGVWQHPSFLLITLPLPVIG